MASSPGLKARHLLGDLRILYRDCLDRLSRHFIGGETAVWWLFVDGKVAPASVSVLMDSRNPTT